MIDLIIYSDGGARGNPGPAGIGVVVKRRTEVGYEEEVIGEISQYLGETTNNQAEYRALLAGLQWVAEHCREVNSIECRLDSELVVKQLRGEYRLKNEGLRPLYDSVMKQIEPYHGRIVFVHVPRVNNKRADWLVNQALDNNKFRP